MKLETERSNEMRAVLREIRKTLRRRGETMTITEIVELGNWEETGIRFTSYDHRYGMVALGIVLSVLSHDFEEGGRVLEGDRDPPGLVTHSREFDLDHVGTEVAE